LRCYNFSLPLQIYWKIGNSPADFSKLLTWWGNTCRGTGVSLYVGYAVYKIDSEAWKADDIINELKLAAKNPEYRGGAFYGYALLSADTGGIGKVVGKYYADSP
jgi:uncharacterized lipoprotein YddW (UPF0748 family)